MTFVGKENGRMAGLRTVTSYGFCFFCGKKRAIYLLSMGRDHRWGEKFREASLKSGNLAHWNSFSELSQMGKC